MAQLAEEVDLKEREAKDTKKEKLRAIKAKAAQRNAATAEARRSREDEDNRLKCKADEDDEKAQDLIRKKQKIEDDRLAFERKAANITT